MNGKHIFLNKNEAPVDTSPVYSLVMFMRNKSSNFSHRVKCENDEARPN